MDNCVQVTKTVLKQLGINYTLKYIEDSIQSHPDHPSLLSITDTLNKYKIENISVKTTAEKLEEFPLPAIIQIKENRTTLFKVLIEFDKNGATYVGEKNKTQEISLEEFKKKWTGVCLLIEKSEESKEENIEKKLTNKKVLNFLKSSFVILITIWAVFLFYNSEITTDTENLLLVLGYSILKIMGQIIGFMLLWYEIDEYNLTLQSFCTSVNEKINCNSVLNSKYAQVFNGTLSLSLISFSYFFGSLGYLVFTGFTISSMSLLSFLSFASLPAIAISVYYQALVIKQWCKFCIAVQLILVAEILISFFGGFYKTNINYETLPLLIALLIFPVIVWKLIKPLLEQEKENNIYKRGLKKIKNNPNVLGELLSKTKRITTNSEGLGISINSEVAKYQILKVCNPYCGPCAKAYPVLEELVNNGKINLQILFTASLDTNDPTLKPVSHFLAIDTLGDKNKTKKALKNWYSAEQKDYYTFASKYPINGDLEEQSDKIDAMRKWCDEEKITHTPTFFLNGHELPKEYNVDDLKEILL